MSRHKGFMRRMASHRTNILNENGKPSGSCCRRYSFRSQLQEAKDTGGCMIHLVETDPSIQYGKIEDATLGNGQKIELEMAQSIGTKVFQVFCPSGKDGY